MLPRKALSKNTTQRKWHSPGKKCRWANFWIFDVDTGPGYIPECSLTSNHIEPTRFTIRSHVV